MENRNMNGIDKNLIFKILEFIKKFEANLSDSKYSFEIADIARKYKILLDSVGKSNRTTIMNALSQKLDLIINQVDSFNYYHEFRTESVLNLSSLSVTEYIISLVRKKHLVDPLLIIRYVYIELAKVLYYDISYINQDKEQQKIIYDAPINPKREKIFSYVVCTQFTKLCKYTLSEFGIELDIKTTPNKTHMWGEIKIGDCIVIVDACDYINGSIDLSNAKACSPTVGFLVLPKEFSGIRILDIYDNPNYKDLRAKMNYYYAINRDLDITLGYITQKGYKTEQIIRENELFHRPGEIISNPREVGEYLDKTTDFFRTVKIPNNMDGYEIFAYYQKFASTLPKNILLNMHQKTLYVDAFQYKFDKARKRFLHLPKEYLEYLQHLIYSRYYKYLSEEEINEFLEQIKNGSVDISELSSQIAKAEMTIADINRRLSLYYAINRLQIFDPASGDVKSIQLYEPMMGSKVFDNADDYDEFRKKLG